MGQADAGDNEAKLMTKLAPEWVRTSDPVIRSPVRYRWTTAPTPITEEKFCQKNRMIIIVTFGVYRFWRAYIDGYSALCVVYEVSLEVVMTTRA